MLPNTYGVVAHWILMVVLNTCQDARGIIVKQLRIRLLPSIGQCPAAHQEGREIVTTMPQELEGSNGIVTRMAIQHVVVATKLILEPWTTAVVNALS